jgi:hypothetical protein
MRVAPAGCRPLGLRWGLLLGLAVSCATMCTLLASDDRPDGLSPDVARVLRWLPEDTETLFVARSVTLRAPPEPSPDGRIQDVPWREVVALNLATEGLALLDGWEHASPCAAGRSPAWRAGRGTSRASASWAACAARAAR